MAREEALLIAMRAGEISDAASDAADAAMMDAFSALRCGVTQPWDHHPAARMLCSALHTLNLALVSEDARDRTAALALASRHPALHPLDTEAAETGMVEARLHRLRGFVDRLEALNRVETCDALTSGSFAEL